MINGACYGAEMCGDENAGFCSADADLLLSALQQK